jgi:hypothetical protein
MKKKITAHHILTPKGGRVASRVKRHPFVTQARTAPFAGGPVLPSKLYYRRVKGLVGLDVLGR